MMFNLVKKDLLISFSNKSIITIFLLFIPLYQLALGQDVIASIPLLSIITFGYMLTTMPFSYEVKNKPYITIHSLPIKSKDVVISKYLSIFINYIIAISITFVYLKFMNILRFNITGNFDIATLKNSFLLLIFGLCISLPLHFRLPPKIANFINIFIYLFLMSYLGFRSGANLSNSTSMPVLAIIISVTYFLSMTISLLLYKSKDLS